MLPLAVDLGTSRVRVAATGRRADGILRMLAVGAAVREAGSDPSEALRAALREAGTTQRRCILMLRAAEAPLQWIRFPKLTARERSRAAAFEGKAALAELDEPVVVRTIEAPDGRSIVGVVTRAVLQRLIGAARAAGLQPAAVHHAGLVLATAGEEATLDVGTVSATLALRVNGVPLVRVIPIGGESFTSALAREFKIEPHQAEHRKQTIGLGGAGSKEVHGFVAGLEAELQTLAQTEGTRVREIGLCGNGARLRELPLAIEQELGIAARPARIERLLETGLPEAAGRNIAFDWFPAAGAGQPVASRMNFIEPALKDRAVAVLRRIPPSSLAMVLVLGTLAAVQGYRLATAEAREERARMGYEALAARVRDFETRAAAVRARIGILRDALDLRRTAAHRAAEIARIGNALPELVALTALRETGEALEIEGRGPRLETIRKALMRLDRASTHGELVDMRRDAQGQVVSFQLRIAER